MTPEQRARLTELLPRMRKMARREESDRKKAERFHRIGLLEHLLALDSAQSSAVYVTDETIQQAERDAEGHDKPGVIKGMTMEQIRSGKPPEEFL